MWVAAISKEEEREVTEKKICATKGKRSYSGAQRNIMAQRGLDITLEGDKW